MNFSFESQGNRTYLVYAVTEDDALDSMSLGMLTNNKIPGLAHTLFAQMDATKFIKYDVSTKISVRQFFTGQVNKKRLIGVFNGIVDAMLSAEEYMIDVNSILLDLDFIFADVSTCETVLICLPVVSGDLSSIDLRGFFKNIMFSTQFDQTENCDHVAKIINYLNSSPVFSFEDFKKLLDSFSGDTAASQVQQPVVQQPVVQQPVVQQPVVQQPAQTRPVQQPSIQQASVQQDQNPYISSVQTPAKTKKGKVQIPPAKNTSAAQQSPTEQPEKKISMFGLLMHYSKENAELYKAQKEAKKNAQPQAAPPPPPKQKKKAQHGFDIPGQSTPLNQGFSVPTSQQATAQPAPAQPQQPQMAAATAQQTVALDIQATQTFYSAPAQPQMPTGQTMNFGETTVLGGGKIGETTVLNAGSSEVQKRPHLIRTKNNEQISLNKPVFRIGKEKSYVDYFVSDNTAVSRSHVNIITRDEQYFIVDTNSTNHTYLNGGMIQSNVEMPLSHGTKIRLANEEFEFRLY